MRGDTTVQSRWWDTIVARRDRQGRAVVELTGDGGRVRAPLVRPEDGANWGYGGAGPWWLAQRLAYLVTGRGDWAVVQAIKERLLEPAPWPGWRLRAADLERVVAPALEREATHV